MKKAALEIQMSVSALDTSVSNPPPHKAAPKAEHKDKAAASSAAGGKQAERVSFDSGANRPGKVFGALEPASRAPDHGNSLHAGGRQSAAHEGEPWGLLKKFKQNVKGWCDGQRPPKPDPCTPPPCYSKPPKPPKPCPPTPPQPDPCYGKPPERPTPGKPDPCHGQPDPWYSNKSNDELAKMLLANFDAFKDPKQPGLITTQGLLEMASKPLTGDAAQDRNIRLARELTKRPELVNAIDRHSTTGALDGLIDRQKIEMTLASQSPLKYSDDKQLAAEMLNHFNGLNDPRYPDYISVDKLQRLAQWPTDHPQYGHLAWIAQEILKRSEVKYQMDGADNGFGTDGWIKKSTLESMLN